mmetsp:Transcript_6243/g.28155  ORF Transcript_6243/g.28155 Transcript_6243/m.28155 type:complete len:270 (-) Transcript_6243:160-969(-)
MTESFAAMNASSGSTSSSSSSLVGLLATEGSSLSSSSSSSIPARSSSSSSRQPGGRTRSDTAVRASPSSVPAPAAAERSRRSRICVARSAAGSFPASLSSAIGWISPAVDGVGSAVRRRLDDAFSSSRSPVASSSSSSPRSRFAPAPTSFLAASAACLAFRRSRTLRASSSFFRFASASATSSDCDVAFAASLSPLLCDFLEPELLLGLFFGAMARSVPSVSTQRRSTDTALTASQRSFPDRRARDRRMMAEATSVFRSAENSKNVRTV